MITKKKILIIDDFEPLLEEIVEFLKYEGFNPISAKNGAEGVQVAMLENPDLIICDIQMPIMNGYQVFQTLEKIPQTATIPFIFLTALTQAEDYRKGLTLGVDDYLTKPFELDVLVSTINKRLLKVERIKNLAQDKFEALISNPLFGAFIYKSNKMVFINERFEHITSYTLQDLNKLNLKNLLIGENEKLISEFKLVLNGIHESFQKKISFINKEKKAVFIEFFAKHIQIESQDAIIGTIIEFEIKNNSKFVSDELSLIISYLNETGKQDITEEIQNIKNIVLFDTLKKKNENLAHLTKREIEILELICDGLKNSEIAEKLFISNRTVDNHRANLLTKTETKNTACLVAYAIRNKIIDF